LLQKELLPILLESGVKGDDPIQRGRGGGRTGTKAMEMLKFGPKLR